MYIKERKHGKSEEGIKRKRKGRSNEGRGQNNEKKKERI